MTLTAVLALGLGSYVLRVAGLTLVSAGRLPEWAELPLRYLPPAVLAALLATLVVDVGQGPRLDARMVGVMVAVGLVWRRVPLILVMVTAAAVTGLLRWFGW